MLLNMMNGEAMIKMQTHAVSTVINFAKGLNTAAEDEEEEDEGSDNTEIIKIYSD